MGAAAGWRAPGHHDAGGSDFALRRAAHGASPSPVDRVPAAAGSADPGHVRRLRGSTVVAARRDIVTAAPIARAATGTAGLRLLVLLAIANAAGYRYGVSDQAFYLPSIFHADRTHAVSARRRHPERPGQADGQRRNHGVAGVACPRVDRIAVPGCAHREPRLAVRGRVGHRQPARLASLDHRWPAASRPRCVTGSRRPAPIRSKAITIRAVSPSLAGRRRRPRARTIGSGRRGPSWLWPWCCIRRRGCGGRYGWLAPPS